MIRLVLKIFLAYWLAARVVLFFQNVVPHEQFYEFKDTAGFDSSLTMNGKLVIDAYENSRCSAIEKLLNYKNDGLAVAAADGRTLCGDSELSHDMALITAAVKSGKCMADRHALYQLIAEPVRSSTGKEYVVLLRDGFGSLHSIYSFFPGYNSMLISCVVTLCLTFLVALPIQSLRKAAQEIAMGNLDARVRWSKISEKIYGFQGKDDVAKLVQDFNFMAERLQALAESQRILLRDMSHELRSPLARLGVGLCLARQEAPAAMREHLDRIQYEARRLNDLIGQILSLSYLETICEVELGESVSLSELIEDLLPNVQYEAANKSCLITTAVTPGCNVRGDAELLRAAVENIVRNSIRFVPDRGLIHIETASVERAGKMLTVVCIDDNGPGIPDGELKSVLEPFYRADKSRYWQHSGFGIGLAIANRAVGVHDGTIDIRNRPEGGLRVQMCFPRIAETV
jgi:two-component system sensor histidine kinase CpxA